MKKTITLSISKDGIARGCGRAAGLALDAGLGYLEGSLGALAVIATLGSSYNPIFKLGMALCEGVAMGFLGYKLNEWVFEKQEEFEDGVSEFVGILIGADDVLEEKEKELEFEKEHCPFSVIG